MTSLVRCRENQGLRNDDTEGKEAHVRPLSQDEIKAEDDATLSDTFLHHWASQDEEEDVKPVIEADQDGKSIAKSDDALVVKSEPRVDAATSSRLEDGSNRGAENQNGGTSGPNKKKDALNGVLAIAPLSQLLDSSCTFECPKCGNHFGSWNSIKRHFARTLHGASNDTQHLRQYLKKVVAYECKVCKERVLCDSNFLKKHVWYSHHMRLSEYKLDFNLKNAPSSKMKRVTQKVLLEGEMSDKVVGDLCTFRCPECQQVYDSINMFNKHSQKSGHAKDRGHMTSYLVRYVTHQCALCPKLLLCDRRTLRSHFVSAHAIKTIEEYCKKTDCTLRTPMKEVKLSVAPTSDEIANLCRYQCNSCDSSFQSFVIMKRHACLRGSKNLNKRVLEFLRKTVAHQCGICQERLLCDKDFLKIHLFGKHGKIGLNGYAKRIGKTITK